MELLGEVILLIPSLGSQMRGEGLKKECARGINNKVLCSEKKKQRLSTGYLFNSCRLTILDQLPDREYKVFWFGVVTEADVSY